MNIKKAVKPIAVYNIGLLDTIFIYDIRHDIENYVLFRRARWLKPKVSKIRYNAKGEPYFISYKQKFYLSEFLRIEGQAN